MGVLGTVGTRVLVYRLTEGVPRPPAGPPGDWRRLSPMYPHDDFPARIEELQERLRNNDREREEARHRIEPWRNTVGSDSSARNGIEMAQERLRNLQMEREGIDHDLDRPRGHR